MGSTQQHAPAATRIEATDVAAALDGIAPHEVRLVAGFDAGVLADLLALAPPRRPVLRLDLAGPGDAAAIIERAIAQLARAVAGLWPYLWGGEDFSGLRDDALTHAHLPLRLVMLVGRLPTVSRFWAVGVVLRLLRGADPRLRGVAATMEWAQLALAFSPAGLVVVVRLDTGEPAWIAAVEWLARNADVSVLVLADALPQGPGFERILYGAREFASAPVPSRDARDNALGEPPLLLALPEADGRPHPQSAVELKLYTLIQADADLRPLFAFNRTIPDLPQLQARADLLWITGRLVVEIDGPEHRGAAKYRADRHRDFELVRAGYRVLRMTNEDIITDAALALGKIRDLVRLAQGEVR